MIPIEIHSDADLTAFSGASAGGNLAAAVALRLRDLKYNHKLTLQVLVVPCLQALDFNVRY